MKATNAEVVKTWIKNVTENPNSRKTISTPHIFFENNVIYSYSREWPLAIFIETTQADKPVHKFIINNSLISPSTSKHSKLLVSNLFLDNAIIETEYKSVNHLLSLI